MNDDRQAWLAERRTGVGASEAGAILGLCPWRTPLEVYLDKLGLVPEKESPRLKWGLRMEAAIAEAYTDETGRPIVRDVGLRRNEAARWMLATPDAIAADRVVEIKRVNQYAATDYGESGSADVPTHVYLQVQQQMACTGMLLADVAALIGHDDFRIFTITRSVEVIDRLVIAERDFMDRVRRQDPPLPDFTHPTTAEILALIEPVIGEVVELGDEQVGWLEQLDALREIRGEADKRISETKAKLIHAMGTAELAHLPGGYTLTRKKVARKGYTVAATEYVDFRIKKPKAKGSDDGQDRVASEGREPKLEATVERRQLPSSA